MAARRDAELAVQAAALVKIVQLRKVSVCGTHGESGVVEGAWTSRNPLADIQ